MQPERYHSRPFRELLKTTGYWRWSLAAQLLRMPALMTAFGFVTISYALTGSERVGGLMITTYVVSSSLLAIPLGRVVDKLGPVTGNLWFSLLTSIVFIAMALTVMEQSPVSVLLVLSGLAGAFLSGTGVRTLLSAAVPESLYRMALSLDASILEVTVAVSPLIAAAVSLWSPSYIPLVMSVCCAVGALVVWTFRTPSSLTVANPSNRAAGSPVNDEERISTPSVRANSHRLWRNRVFWFWILIEFALGHVFGTIESAVLPWTVGVGQGVATAGVALTVLSICSGIGGVVYMRFAEKFKGYMVMEVLALFTVVEVGCLLFAISEHWAVGLAGMVLIGFCTAPLNAVISAAAASSIPKVRQTEGFAALGSANTAGYGLGGLLLAVLPLHWMMLAVIVTGAGVLGVAPVLMSKRTPGTEAHPENHVTS